MSNNQFNDFVNGYIVKYEEALNNKNALVVNYSDLDDSAKLLDVVRHLKPETTLTIEAIDSLQGCIIQTKNNDLTQSVASLGGTVDATRTLDIELCASVLLREDIFSTISEDGATHNDVKFDVLDNYWIKLTTNGALIGIMQLKQIFSKGYEGHIHILPEYRKRLSMVAGSAIIKWCEDNIKGSMLITNVPDIYQNVVAFLKEFGFEQTGFLPKCFTKNNKQHNLVILARAI